VPSQWKWRGVCAGRDAFGAAAVVVVVVFLAIALSTTRMKIEKIGKMETGEVVRNGEKAREVRVEKRLMETLMEK